MRIERNTTQTPTTPIITAVKVVREGFVLSGAFITSVDGLYYISELAMSIFDLADKVAAHAPKALHRTVEILRGHPALHHTINLVRGYMDFTCVLDIINRGKEWMSKDDNGNYIWERDWPTLFYYISLTSSDLTNHLCLLDKFKFIRLGVCFTPIGHVYTAATISQNFFQSWTTFDELRTDICRSERCKSRHLVWKYRASQSSTAQLREIIAAKARKWEKISDEGNERILTKKLLWTKIVQAKNDDELHKFVCSMADRAEISEKNSTIKVLTTYCSLVCTVSYLALLVLQAFVAIWAIKEVILATAILTVIVNAIYVGDFIIEHYFKEITVPDPFLPTVYDHLAQNTTPL